MINRFFALMLLMGLLLPFAALAQRNDVPGRPGDTSVQVSLPDHFDKTSVPLRDIPDKVPTHPARGGRDFEPGNPFPIGNTNPATDSSMGPLGVGESRASIQPLAGTTGVPVDPNYRVAPPDTTGDLGPNHYVQWVNLRYAVYDITRDASNNITGFNLVPGFPKNGNAVWSGFGGGCETNNDGDPIVQYDQAADRWILTQFSVSTTPYLQCVAVSQTGDPTGLYNRYSYSFGTDFNDFPKMGIWNDTYVITYNLFKRGRTFSGGDVCGYERSQMLSGGAARQICVKNSSYASFLPADVEGSVNPPAGSAVPILSLTSSAVKYAKFAVNWTAGTASFSTPVTISGVNSYSEACGGGTCIPQPGTSNQLDSLANRLNYRLSYRNFGDHEALLVNHAIAANGGTGIRWYEFRNAAGQTVSTATPVVYQQGTYAPSSDYRWMGSAAMDKAGGIAIGYNISNGSTIAPSIRYAYRSATDTPGTLSAENSIFTGPGSQTGTLHRWGDYSTVSVDPVGGCSMVFTTEYIPSNGNFNWSTYIYSFKLSSCN